MMSMSAVRNVFWQLVSRGCGRPLGAEEVRLQRVHAGHREQRGRIVPAPGSATPERTRLWSRVLEELEKCPADLVRRHRRLSVCGSYVHGCPRRIFVARRASTDVDAMYFAPPHRDPGRHARRSADRPCRRARRAVRSARLPALLAGVLRQRERGPGRDHDHAARHQPARPDPLHRAAGDGRARDRLRAGQGDDQLPPRPGERDVLDPDHRPRRPGAARRRSRSGCSARRRSA